MATLWKRFIIHICLIVTLRGTFIPSLPILIAQLSKLCRDFLSLHKFLCLNVSFSWFFLVHSLIFFLSISFVLLLLLMIALTVILGIQLLAISPSSELLFFQSCKDDPSLLLRTQNCLIHAYKKKLASSLTNLMSTQKSQTLYYEAVLTHHGSVGQWALLKVVVLCSYILSFLFCLLLFLIPSFCLCYIGLVARKKKQKKTMISQRNI